MQQKFDISLFKRFSLAVAAAFMLNSPGLMAAQYNFTDPVSSVGNNFTMLGATAGIIGGTNDVTFDWDGTLNDAVAGAVSNATVTSDEAFFFNVWDAHDVTLYGPGSYTIFDGCAAGDAACGVGNPTSFTVGANQIGAHMLFDWPKGSPPGPNGNIDVVIVWNYLQSWATQNPLAPFYAGIDDGTACTTGSGQPPCVVDGLPNTANTVFSLISTDVNGDGVPGAPMSDGAFAGSLANFNFNGVKFPPVAVDDNAGTTAATPVTINIAGNDFDPDSGTPPGVPPTTIQFTNPSMLPLTDNGNGTITVTPIAAAGSTDTLQYTLTDSDAIVSNSATVSINVTAAANNPPVANNVAFNTDEDNPLQIAITDMDDLSVLVATDGDSDPLTFSSIAGIFAQSGDISVNGTNTVLTYTPRLNFNGTDTFRFTALDGIDDSTVATATITVNPVNDAPVCIDITVNTDLDTPVTISKNALIKDCRDVELDTITLDSWTQPMLPGSMLVDNGTTLTYTPPLGVNGQDTFTFTASDGALTDTKTVTIDIGKVFGNFTMLDAGGSTFGGTNDIVATWDEVTVCTSEADLVSDCEMIMGSDSNFKFFGFPWFAHDIRVFGPGTYSFDATCTAAQVQMGMSGNCGGGPGDFLNVTVGAGQVGAHMLFDWNVTADIDVFDLYERNAVWTNPDPNGALYLGPTGPVPDPSCAYDYLSVDGDGDGVPGVRFVDGPFIDFRANFNLNFNQNCPAGTGLAPPTSAAKATVGGCSLSAARITPMERSDYWILLGFIALLGFAVTRRRLQGNG